MLLEDILQKYPKQESYLIEILLQYQATKESNYISREEIEKIASYLNVTESKVCSVISFYTFFSTEPRGKYIIQVCKSVPCHVNDQIDVLKTIENLLGVRAGETTPNQKFTVEAVGCLGACDKAPVMRIDGKLYTHLTVDKIKAIISEYRG